MPTIFSNITTAGDNTPKVHNEQTGIHRYNVSNTTSTRRDKMCCHEGYFHVRFLFVMVQGGIGMSLVQLYTAGFAYSALFEMAVSPPAPSVRWAINLYGHIRSGSWKILMVCHVMHMKMPRRVWELVVCADYGINKGSPRSTTTQDRIVCGHSEARV